MHDIVGPVVELKVAVQLGRLGLVLALALWFAAAAAVIKRLFEPVQSIVNTLKD